MNIPSIRYLSFTNLRRKLGGRSRSSIYRDLELGRLPLPVKIGARLYWRDHEVDEFLSVHPVGGDQPC